MQFEKCKEILLKECELVQEAASLQKLIEKAVKSREWTDFEGHFEAMNAIEGEIAGLEQKREELFAFLNAAGQDGSQDRRDDKGLFYAFAAGLPAAERAELTAIYRSLKLESLKLRTDGETLMSYLGGAQATLAGFFEAAFPDRGGRIYTQAGTPVSHDMRSMVLDRRM